MSPILSTVKLRVAALMRARDLTAYALARDSGGRISRRTAYRLANEEKAALYPEEIAALCDILGVEPGELFEYVPETKGKRK
jgi:DNA-binding Xre family transcriptional regulator